MVATDDRGFGTVLVLLGDLRNFGACELRREGVSYLPLAGSAVESDKPVPDDAFRMIQDGIGPPWTPERAASANPLFEWRDLAGIAPAGTTSVRVVVGDRVVEATMAGRMFAVAWPVDRKASLVVALDADGAVIARLSRQELDAQPDGAPGR